jgi:uncharacterized membrane protein YtjA (UPF0391 family)
MGKMIGFVGLCGGATPIKRIKFFYLIVEFRRLKFPSS